MPESSTHARLVQQIVAFAGRELGPLAEIAVREDAIRPLRGERPPRIGGFTPDVYATDVPTTKTLIGEAKTQVDLETAHSHRQITAFLNHLALTPGGMFVLAVPLAASATGRRLISQLCTHVDGEIPRYIVLDGTGLGER